MYILDPAKKNDPIVRWNLPDRIFFGHGACHILAGVYLKEFADSDFQAFWIVPPKHPGAHVFVSDGQTAFDYHGYSIQSRLESHHQIVWERQHHGWTGTLRPVDFDLLDEADLNARNMRGPNQYLGDPVIRAREFIQRIDQASARQRIQSLL